MRARSVSWLPLVGMTALAVVVAIIAAALLAWTVRFGREMAGYLETSTGLAVDRAPATTTEPLVPPQTAPSRVEPATETPAAEKNEDAAELRSTAVPADPPQ